MRGQLVVCKDVIGEPIVLRVWEDGDGVVYVHSFDQFDAHIAGLPHLAAVGFPIEDVFEYDEAALGQQQPFTGLKPYTRDLPIKETAPPEGSHVELVLAMSR